MSCCAATRASFDLVDMGVLPGQRESCQSASARSEAVPSTSALPSDGGLQLAPKPAPPPSPPIVIHFKACVSGLAVGASLLPSLRAQYKVGACLKLIMY